MVGLSVHHRNEPLNNYLTEPLTLRKAVATIVKACHQAYLRHAMVVGGFDQVHEHGFERPWLMVIRFSGG